jgi:hypothetical protein
MSTTRKVLFSVVFAVVVGGLIIGLGTGYGGWGGARTEPGAKVEPNDPTKSAPDQPGKEIPIKGEPEKKDPPIKADPAVKEGPKLLTMAEAVTLAEKIGKGYTMKAERIDQPNLRYEITVAGINGKNSIIDLAGDGKVLPPSKSTTAPTMKGKKKGGNQPKGGETRPREDGGRSPETKPREVEREDRPVQPKTKKRDE